MPRGGIGPPRGRFSVSSLSIWLPGHMVPRIGIEPMTHGLEGRCSNSAELTRHGAGTGLCSRVNRLKVCYVTNYITPTYDGLNNRPVFIRVCINFFFSSWKIFFVAPFTYCIPIHSIHSTYTFKSLSSN